MGYRVFPDVNRIGRPKAVTSIPILLGHCRQLRKLQFSYSSIASLYFDMFVCPSVCKKQIGVLGGGGGGGG